MGKFKGHKKKGLALSIRKNYKAGNVFNLLSSTPRKTISTKRKRLNSTLSPYMKRQKYLSPIKSKTSTPRKLGSNIKKNLHFRNVNFEKYTNDKEQWETDSEDSLCEMLEETCLYSDGPSLHEESFSSIPEPEDLNDKIESELDNFEVNNILDEVITVLSENEAGEEFVTFLKLVAERKFPLDNVAFRLFLDVVRWFNCDDIRSMRYNDTSLKFFWIGKHLFGGRFLRFMSGPKNESDLLLGKTQLCSSDSRINFACPSDSVIAAYNPVGYDITVETEPGIIKPMINLFSENSDKKSYIITFDGKKVRRGGDVNLLGFETDPQSEKKEKFNADIETIDRLHETLRNVNKIMEDDKEMGEETNVILMELLKQCFRLFSNHLKELRKLKVSKTLALKKYKEKIAKDPSLSKSLEYAMDSCRTSKFQIENCIADLIDAQWHLCRAVSYLNGALDLYAKAKEISIESQRNVHLLQTVEEMKLQLNTDDLPTHCIKQRSKEWFEARKTEKVTGSTVYAAVGCDSLKRQKEHFDHVMNNVDKPEPAEFQQHAMKHGVDSENHEIATLASIVMPYLSADLVYQEEGYYRANNVLVSPDGSLRDSTGVVQFAFEGKAPVGNDFATKQHYTVPDRYITQTVFEQNVLEAQQGTLYLCWTAESTTVFIVPVSEAIHSDCLNIIDGVFLTKSPKKPTRLSNESKVLKETIREHASKCEFVGEFPSVRAMSDKHTGENEENIPFSYHELTRAVLKSRNALKETYKLQRKNASQVLVYLLSDLDRLWKSELPHAVPVMYCYRGYSLSMDTARSLLDHCWKACKAKGLDVIATSSDGEFIQLMTKDKDGNPLTEFQLSKFVWNEVCKMKKGDIVKQFKSLNKEHKRVVGDDGNLEVVSVDGGSQIRTPNRGWKRNVNPIERMGGTEIDEIIQENEGNAERSYITEEPETSANIDTENKDLDETVEYDFEKLLDKNDISKSSVHAPVKLKEAGDILSIFIERNPKKWRGKSADKLRNVLSNKIDQLTKDELLQVALYINKNVKDTENEIKVERVKKYDLVEQLSQLFGRPSPSRPTKKKRIIQPKTLHNLASAVLMKNTFPKQVLNIAYATHIWPERLKVWRKNGRVSEKVIVHAKSNDYTFSPYYIPEFDPTEQEFRVFTYDKTHLGTNLRKCLCLDKVKGVSIKAWKEVSEAKPNIIHPSLIEVSDEGKILDQMKEKLARSMVSIEVENEMRTMGFEREAKFCCVIREGLYIADDVPGIPSSERCVKRMALINWLKESVDFGKFPPYGGTVKGMSNVLYEGLRSSQEAKLYLYALAKTGTYCVRSANTLCSESFFGTMQEMDPWGQGILSTDGVKKHIADFTTITSMKMESERNVYIKTKKDTVYPPPEVLIERDQDEEDGVQDGNCFCRKNKFIQCIVPRDHFFDTKQRARLYKGEKTYQPSTATETLKGELPIRAQYGYKINEARMLPSKRLALGTISD